MAETRELADRLAEFDARFAGAVLELICSELGRPRTQRDPDVAQMRAFLARPEAAQSRPLKRMSDVSDSAATTSEWKSEFGRSERLRALGVALAERLAAGVPK